MNENKDTTNPIILKAIKMVLLNWSARLSNLADSMHPLDERAAGTQNGLRIAAHRLAEAAKE